MGVVLMQNKLLICLLLIRSMIRLLHTYYYIIIAFLYAYHLSLKPTNHLVWEEKKINYLQINSVSEKFIYYYLILKWKRRKWTNEEFSSAIVWLSGHIRLTSDHFTCYPLKINIEGKNWVQRKIQIILVGIKILYHRFITISPVLLVACVCPVFRLSVCDLSYSWIIFHIYVFFFSLEYFIVSKAVWFILLSIIMNSSTLL